MVNLTRPLIFDFCVPRTSESQKPVYVYDFKKNLNVIKIGEKLVPLVNADKVNYEMLTKTEANREADDEISEAKTNYFQNNGTSTRERKYQKIVELETFTRIEREGNDNSMFLELMTKTDTERERDDE